MKFFYILLLSLLVVGVSSLPVHPGETLGVNPSGISQELPSPVDSPPHASVAPSDSNDLQVDIFTTSDHSGGVLGGASGSSMQTDELDTVTAGDSPTASTPASPSPNTTSRLISPLIIISCITFAIFLAVLVGFSWIICRYGRNAKLLDDEERIISETITVSQASAQLKPTVIEEERLPRAPSPKRFKRYASGKVPLGIGPVPMGPPGKHSKQNFRRPSPLRHVFSAPSFTCEVPDSPASSLCSDSVNYSCSDASSSCSVDMPPTPDLDDLAVRRELFDLDDPFACLSPCVPRGPTHSPLKVPTASAERNISDAYDSCWIIGEYADTDNEEEDDVGREHVHSPWYVFTLRKSLKDGDVIATDHSTLNLLPSSWVLWF